MRLTDAQFKKELPEGSKLSRKYLRQVKNMYYRRPRLQTVAEFTERLFNYLEKLRRGRS